MSQREFPNCTASEEEVIDFLDDLRDSGTTNMFGATPYLEQGLDMNAKEAKEALLWWMEQC